MSKSNTVKAITPKGELAWVNITGEGKANMSGKQQYLASVVLDPKNKQADKDFIDSIDEFWADNKPTFMGKRRAKSLGYSLCDPLRGEDGQVVKDDEDKIKYDPDGRVSVKFATGIGFPDGSKKIVRIFNAKAKEVALGNVKIGNGSIGSISGAMAVYEVKDNKGKALDAGVTLYLDAIQIFKLVEYSTDAGFTAAEDGDEDESWTGDEGFEGVADEPAADKPKNAGPRL